MQIQTYYSCVSYLFGLKYTKMQLINVKAVYCLLILVTPLAYFMFDLYGFMIIKKLLEKKWSTK